MTKHIKDPSQPSPSGEPFAVLAEGSASIAVGPAQAAAVTKQFDGSTDVNNLAVSEVLKDEIARLHADAKKNTERPYIYKAKDRRIYKANKTGRPTPICGLIGGATVSIDPEGTSTMTVSFMRIDGKVGRVTFSYADLSSATAQAVWILRNAGCEILGKASDVADYLRTLKVAVQENVASSYGWHPKGLQVFRLPNNEMIALSPDLQASIGEAALHDNDAVAVDSWKTSVAAKFSGNPMALFFLCVSFLGVLMTLLGLPVQGLNLVASTSTGKTSLMRVLAQVWPATSVLKWTGTTAGTESVAARANDTILVLDEAPLAKPRVMADTIMFLFNGTGRNLVSRPKTQTWAMPVVSTSERRIGAVMRANSGADFFQEGILVRVLDVSAKAEKGRFWNNIHGAKDAPTFLDALTATAIMHSGVAGPAFVHEFLRRKRGDAIVKLFQREQTRLLRDLGLEGQKVDGTVSRGLRYFAATTTAGLVAASWRILPQAEDEIRSAILEVARNWYDATTNPEALVLGDAVEDLRLWLSLKGDRKLMDISFGNFRGTQAHVGWRDDNHLYLPGFVLQSIAPKVDLAAFVAHLRDQGILEPGTEQDSLQYKMGSKYGRPRVYRIKTNALVQGGNGAPCHKAGGDGEPTTE